MGSSGSSRFSDYPERPSSEVVAAGGRGGTAGGSSGQDRCDKAFSVDLEDFEQSAYFHKHAAPPKVGTNVVITKGARVSAKISGGLAIGNLPTPFNYLAACLAGGRKYSGKITAVSGSKVVKITIDAAPE
jgi:hypothetical protein